jgi:hypothetical protein
LLFFGITLAFDLLCLKLPRPAVHPPGHSQGEFMRWIFVDLVVVVLPSSMTFAAVPSRNLPQALHDVKAQLANGGSADIVVLGDSLSFRDGSYLPYFRQHLQAQYGNGGAGYQGFSLWTGAGFNGWIREGIGTDLMPHRSLDGLWNQSSVGPHHVSGQHSQAYYTPWSRQVTLQYVAQPGGGSFQVRQGYDGAVVTTLDTIAAQEELRTWQYTLPAGQTTYTIQPQGDGMVTILGQDNARASTGVRVHRAANGGWGVDNFLQRDWTFDEQLDQIGTDLVMVWLGQNDQGYSRAGYAAKLDQLVDRLNAAAPGAEVVLVGTYDQGSPNLPQLVDAMDDVAAARGLGFINIYGTAGDRAFFDANGYLDDGVHFSPAGGAYLGDFLFDAFVTDGASLVPEPASTCTVTMTLGMIAIARRRRR